VSRQRDTPLQSRSKRSFHEKNHIIIAMIDHHSQASVLPLEMAVEAAIITRTQLLNSHGKDYTKLLP
jgi:hypothetical protein